MPPASGPREDDARLSGARAEFVGSLPRRLDALRGALEAAEQLPTDPERVNGLLRRVHAVSSAARVLGFASVAEALAEAERSVRKVGPRSENAPFAEVARALDLLPSLVLGAPVSTRGPESRERSSPTAFPISALVLGSQALADALSSGTGKAPVDSERTDDPARALELARMLGPDVAIIDGDHPGARELVTKLLADDLVEPLPIVVVGSFDNPESTRNYVDLGADRVLPKPCSPDTLRRTVEELRERARPRTSREPLGDVSVQGLVERISTEFRRGLVDALDAGSPNARVPLGEGQDVLSAVWGAVARVRELVTLRSSGELRFQQTGPEGGVPLVPWGASERRAGERGPSAREGTGVSLQGRRVIVADDDPAVVWFMGGLLKAVGIEVIEVHDGKRALERTFALWPDVVVSDVLMPKLDGFSLCHEIKRDVAVRDTPVILLSWKEDLLQRVRELGAGADGYLRKEAAASAVVERVREVLRSRARVEERIFAGGEVRGRLDGLTPRLVLELACRGERDVRVSVRDAAFLFEAQVRRGRVVSLTRSSQDGAFERGASVFPSLLGASAGRFVVEPDSSYVRTELSGTLGELVSGPVTKIRSALAAVASSSIVRIKKLELDRALVEAYLASTPEPAASLTQRLLAGESARTLLLDGAVASRLLETVLSDIARRGAILSAELDPPSIPAPMSDPPAAPAPFTPGEGLPGVGFAPTPASAPPPGLITSSASSTTTVSGPSVNLLRSTLQTASKAMDDDDAGWFSDAAEEPSVPAETTEPAAEPSFGGEPGSTPELIVEAPDVARESIPPEGAPEPFAESPSVAEAAPAPTPPPAEPLPVSLRVAGFAATMPLDQSPTPALDVTIPAASPAQDRTLEGVGPAPVKPRPREASAPELTPEGTTEEVLGLLSDSDVHAAEAATVEPAPDAISEPPHSPLPVPKADARRLPTEPPSRVTRAARPAVPKDAERAVEEQTPAPAEAGWGAVLLKGGLAFFVAFALTSWVLPLLSPAPSADPASESPGSEPAAAAPKGPGPLVSEELELPTGIELGAGQGLIEIETAGPEAIHIDGSPVGNGPIRRVPAAPGVHRVEVHGSGWTLSHEVTLVAGRRTRVRSASEPAAGPTTAR